MIVVERKPVPVYEVECYECHSKIEYKRAEVSTCHIRCPVCGCTLWANMISPSSYSMGGADPEPPEEELTDE